MEGFRNSRERRENPLTLYHGSASPAIAEFEPRRRYTPHNEDAPPRVYATGNPAFAAAHAFPWSSDEGVELSVVDGLVTLRVPQQIASRLAQKVYLYQFDPSVFAPTEAEATGETFHTEQVVKPKDVQSFDSVTSAVEFFGGVVEIIPTSASVMREKL